MMVPLSGAPMSSQRQSESREELVAQSLLLFIVFRSRDRQDRRGARRSDHVANTHCLARTRIGDDYMPASLEPCLTQQTLKPALKGGLAVMWTLVTLLSICA